MKIESTAVALPSREISNEFVLDAIRRESKEFAGDLNHALEIVHRLLKVSGTKSRHWLDRGETPLDLMAKACRQAMDGLGDCDDIDMIIYASVYAELLEPATANVVAHKIGLDNVECFDLNAACDGWMKAAKLASALIEGGTCRRIMIVNAEFPMIPGFAVYPKLFEMTSLDQLEWRFPAFTLGEAASATILGPDQNNNWSFHNKTRNDKFDLCTVTSPYYGIYPLNSPRIAKDGAGVFTSFGMELRKHGFPLAIETFVESGIQAAEIDLFLTHSSSKSDWQEGARRIGLGRQHYDIHEQCGNVISVSIPAAIALAEEKQVLKRGYRVAALAASAGMTCSTTAFTY